ncbi:hypothetical protein Tco_0857226 [Tanacetum coccineum]|uniref:Uncharacterized protein n=1 Tax=Tanacetum coccineum TaxID=301880 RepID=A0ABQ5B9W3_9ASTR
MFTQMDQTLHAIETRLNNGEGTSQRRDNGGQTSQHGGPNGGAYGRLTKSKFPKFEGDEPNTGKQEKKRRTCVDYLKYEESHVRIKCGSISMKKKSNYSSFQVLRSSCNEYMVKYEDPRPSTTRTRALNERFNKMISPASTQPPGWRLCRSADGFAARQEALLPGSWSLRFSLQSRKNLDNQEGSRPSKPTLDTPLDPGIDIKK